MTFQQFMNLLIIIGGIIGSTTGAISIWREYKRNQLNVQVDTTEILSHIINRTTKFKVVTVHNLSEKQVKIVTVYLCDKRGKKGNLIILSSRHKQLPCILKPQESANFFFIENVQLDEAKRMNLKYAACLVKYRKEFISEREYSPEIEVHYSFSDEFSSWVSKITSKTSI